MLNFSTMYPFRTLVQRIHSELQFNISMLSLSPMYFQFINVLNYALGFVGQRTAAHKQSISLDDSILSVQVKH